MVDHTDIELGAYDYAKLTDSSVASCSIAMSLKRIADGLEHSESGGIPNILDAMLDALSEIAAALHPEEHK